MDSVSILQLGKEGTSLFQENKKQLVRILELLFLCLLFYKYPQVLSGA